MRLFEQRVRQDCLALSQKERPTIRLAWTAGPADDAAPIIDLGSTTSAALYRYSAAMRQRSTKAIDPAGVSRLLSRLSKIGFYRITEQSVDASIDKVSIRTTKDGATAGRIFVTDCATATLSVRDRERTHRVSYYAVEEMAKYYPKATDLSILKKAIDEVLKAVRESGLTMRSS